MEERERRRAADRGETERRVKTGRGSRVMDGCVFLRVRGEVRGERGVCEGAIKAVYYKSVTERVCGDNGGMSLSILPPSG